MSKTISKMLSCVLALMVVITGVVPSIGEVSAATTDLKITSVKVVNTETGAVVADLMAGQKPKLNVFSRRGLQYSAGVTKFRYVFYCNTWKWALFQVVTGCYIYTGTDYSNWL